MQNLPPNLHANMMVRILIHVEIVFWLKIHCLRENNELNPRWTGFPTSVQSMGRQCPIGGGGSSKFDGGGLSQYMGKKGGEA